MRTIGEMLRAMASYDLPFEDAVRMELPRIIAEVRDDERRRFAKAPPRDIRVPKGHGSPNTREEA